MASTRTLDVIATMHFLDTCATFGTFFVFQLFSNFLVLGIIDARMTLLRNLTTSETGYGIALVALNLAVNRLLKTWWYEHRAVVLGAIERIRRLFLVEACHVLC